METAADKMRIAFEMHRAGVAMHRLTLRRRHPQMTDAEIDAALEAWLLERPGAEWGDGEGTPCSFPR